jgi:Holliday junction resolvase RusA-like endonuclease
MTDTITTTERRLLRFHVSGAPVTDNRRLGRRGKRSFLTKAAREWEEVVAQEAQLQLALLHNQRARLPIGKDLRVNCVFVGVRGDAANYLKCTLDGLANGLQINDRLFRPVQVDRQTVKAAGATRGAMIEVFEAAP